MPIPDKVMRHKEDAQYFRRVVISCFNWDLSSKGLIDPASKLDRPLTLVHTSLKDHVCCGENPKGARFQKRLSRDQRCRYLRPYWPPGIRRVSQSR